MMLSRAAMSRDESRAFVLLLFVTPCLSLFSIPLSAAPPQLLTGSPKTPDIPNVDGDVIRIVVDVDADEEVRVFPDRLEWTHLAGEGPAPVKVNGVTWQPQAQKQLSAAENPTVIPKDYHPLGAAIDVVYGRGYINFYTPPGFLHVRLTDPEPGGAPADFVLRPGEHLPAYEADPRHVARIAQLAAEDTKRPHPQGPEAKTRKDLKQAQARWRRKCLAGAYEEFGWRNPAWDNAAIAFLEKWATEPPLPREEIIRAGDELLDLGCDDPLVCGVLGEALWKDRNPSRAEPLVLHAVLGFEQSKYPARTTRRMPAILARITRRRSPEDWRRGEGLYARCIAETVSAVSEKLDGGERRAILYELQAEFKDGAHDLFRGHRPQLVRAIADSPDVDPWVSHLLQAQYLYDQGWQARGTGWAVEVTETGWDDFRGAIQRAQAHLVDAWGLYPELPDAAVLLISTTLTAGGISGESRRFWFDEAVAAQMDVFGAHSNYFNGLLPRWGGDHRSVMEFGIECLRTRRYDTVVPLYLYNAVWHVASEGGDAIALLKELGVLDEMGPLMETFVRESAGALPLARIQTENAVMAWALGMRDEARKYLEAAGPNLDATALRNRNIDSALLKYDVLTPTKSAASVPARLPLGTLFSNPAPVLAMDVSPAGDMIATSSEDKEHLLTRWDLATVHSEAVAVDNQLAANFLRFSPDGKSLAGIQYGSTKPAEGAEQRWGTLTVWDMANGASREVVPREQQFLYGIGWLPDNRHIASSVWSAPTKVWNVETGRVVAQTENAISATSTAVSADGKLLAVGQFDGTIRLYSLPEAQKLGEATGDPHVLPEAGVLLQHLRMVVDLKFSPNGKWLASASWEDRSVWIWDVALRKPLHRVEGYLVAFSPDSRRLATAEGFKLPKQGAIWDVDSGRALCRLVNSDTAYLRSLTFTADGAFLVAAAHDSAIRTWDASPEEPNPAGP